MIEMNADVCLAAFGELEHNRPDGIDGGDVFVQLCVRTDDGDIECLRSVKNGEQTFKIGRVECTDCNVAFFCFFNDFFQGYKHVCYLSISTMS